MRATCQTTSWGSSSAGNGSRFQSGSTTRGGATAPRSPVGFSSSIGAARPMRGWRSNAITWSRTSGIRITPSVPSRTPTGPRSTPSSIRRSLRSRRSRGCVGATDSRPIRGSRNTTTTANRSMPCWCARRPRISRAISRRITRTPTIPTSSTSIRRTREVRAAGAAGGVLFAWLDEWFKHTWVTIELEVPPERSRLWHNVEDAEQHYGLMGEYGGVSADATPAPGGDPTAWRALSVLARGDSLVLRVGADPSYLDVALAGRPEFDSARYVIGIDTYRRDRGQFRLPGVAGPTDAVGCEFALVLNDTSDAQLMVAPWYNPFLGPRSGMGPTGLD